ncbi:MAG: serine/threonine protein phosphatase [Candidatus Parabeggiatoa sp. nov. 2]|nr:MAG: serine/threonine protein phosphatase [Beggiatoa sp. 4572_84]RKZ58942.1 MAG: serine/threonine protein phosphatase [Gammaproteobacteria bacterium]
MNAVTESHTQKNIEFQDYVILIIDDNPTNLGVLVDYLADSGFKIMIARNGEMGLKRAQARPDMILLDVIMPGIDGFETCYRLKADETTKDIPVIFMTALESTEDKLKGFKVGGVDYVTKPIQHEEVLARLTTHLRIQELTRKLQKTNQALKKANQQITALNERLKEENLRMSAELDITRRLQQMVLPKEQELKQITELDIASFMEPAYEVGGDYYDVLQHNGSIKIGIGDVTGHGLESGVLMLMVQTAVRTLLNNNVTDPEKFLKVINRTVYDNMQRLCSDKNLTLSLLDYRAGRLRLTGQHEEVLVVRKGGKVERIDTFNLGFMIGVEPDITQFVSQMEITLQPGDGIVLYTDGITEARNPNMELYELDRLCEVISRHWHLSAAAIQQAVIADVRQYIDTQKVYDDITLLVLKQK